MALTKITGEGIQGISNSSDATAITISSGEDLTMSQASVDFWRMNAHDSSSGTDITAWERPDDGYNAYINGLTVSSGVFSFTKTGLYKFDVVVQGQNVSSADSSFGVSARVSTNSGGAYDRVSEAYTAADHGSRYTNASAQAIVSVTNVSTFRLRIETEANGNFNVRASNGQSVIDFIRLGDAT